MIFEIETSDNVKVSVYSVEGLKDRYPDWDSFSREEKLRKSRCHSPIRTEEVSNTTCVGLHEYIIDNLDNNQSVNENASHLAVGDDNTSPATSNTDLNNEVGRVSLTDTTDNGNSLDTSTFIDTSQLNGNTLREVGLVNQSSSSGDILFNHSTISEIVKTDLKVVTIDVTLTASAA